ncbi:hypothetical protein Bca101_029882 [Brassica carinata]
MQDTQSDFEDEKKFEDAKIPLRGWRINRELKSRLERRRSRGGDRAQTKKSGSSSLSSEREQDEKRLEPCASKKVSSNHLLLEPKAGVFDVERTTERQRWCFMTPTSMLNKSPTARDRYDHKEPLMILNHYAIPPSWSYD